MTSGSSTDNWRTIALWVFVCAAVVELCAMAGMMPLGNFSQVGIPLRFVITGVVAGCGYLGAVYWFGAVTAVWRKAVFWGMAVLLRVLVFPIEPGDDIWRYIWEGMIQNEGHSPYLLAPDAAALAHLRPEWWELINHRDWATIYPPGAELCFAAMARISASAWFFKLVFALADLVIVFFVLRVHTGSCRYRDAAWYAWNPLVVYSFAGGGHFDSLMLVLMTASMWALHRANPMGQGRPVWHWACLSGVFLGCAISVKIIPVLLVPLWVMVLGRRFWVLLPGLCIPGLLALWYGFPGIDVFASLGKFADVARTNDLVWWVFDLVGLKQSDGLNTVGNALIGLSAGVLALVFARDWRRGSLWVLGTALILSPIVHAWYLAWILPIAAWRRSYPWFVFSVSMFVYFMLWDPRVSWEPGLGYRLSLLLPPLLAIVALYGRRWLQSHREPQNI